MQAAACSKQHSNSQQSIDLTFVARRSCDQLAFTNDLYKWSGTNRGARVGRDEVIITFVTGFGLDFSQKATALFVAQVYLPGGTIVAQGYGQINPNGASKYTFPVVGGTGAYANVGGYVKVRDLGNGNQNKTNLEFHLMPEVVPRSGTHGN